MNNAPLPNTLAFINPMCIVQVQVQRLLLQSDTFYGLFGCINGIDVAVHIHLNDEAPKRLRIDD